MKRRQFTNWMAGAPLLGTSLSTAQVRSAGKIILPSLPHAAPLSEVVLFGFDDRAFPFQNQVQRHLSMGQSPSTVLTHGAPGAHDEVLLYYG